MKQCTNCGVEVEGSPEVCPLCGNPLPDYESVSHGASGGPPPEGASAQGAEAAHAAETTAAGKAEATYAAETTAAGRTSEPGPTAPEASSPQRRRARFWLWEMFTIVIAATAIIVAAADFGYGFDLGWSAYPLTALAAVWLFVTAVTMLGRDIPLAYASATVVVLGYLFVLDLLTGGQAWFVPFALPIGLLVAVVGGAAAGTARSLKLSVFQTLAIALIFIGLFLVGLEVILSFAMDLDSIVSWSIVALGGCLSIALLLWIINRRLRERHADFKRLFHL